VLAFNSVSAYLPALKEIVKTSAQYRKEAAALVGRGALLSSMFAHRAQPAVAVQYAQEAVVYSKESGDLALWVSTVDWLVWTHYHNRNSRQAQEEIERIMPVLKKQEASLPARLLGGVYSAYAVMLARNGQSATKIHQQAHETFLSASPEEQDTGYYILPEIMLNRAHVHYYQGEYDTSLETLGQLIDVNNLSTKVPMPERARLDILNRMTFASLKKPEKDMELSTKLWQAQMHGAIARRSARLYQDGLNSYDIMETLWMQEARVKELRDLIVHW
jgi:tetratricopeptide (TPR) repeat protein